MFQEAVDTLVVESVVLTYEVVLLTDRVLSINPLYRWSRGLVADSLFGPVDFLNDDSVTAPKHHAGIT